MCGGPQFVVFHREVVERAWSSEGRDRGGGGGRRERGWRDRECGSADVPTDGVGDNDVRGRGRAVHDAAVFGGDVAGPGLDLRFGLVAGGEEPHEGLMIGVESGHVKRGEDPAPFEGGAVKYVTFDITAAVSVLRVSEAKAEERQGEGNTVIRNLV